MCFFTVYLWQPSLPGSELGQTFLNRRPLSLTSCPIMATLLLRPQGTSSSDSGAVSVAAGTAVCSFSSLGPRLALVPPRS